MPHVVRARVRGEILLLSLIFLHSESVTAVLLLDSCTELILFGECVNHCIKLVSLYSACTNGTKSRGARRPTHNAICSEMPCRSAAVAFWLATIVICDAMQIREQSRTKFFLCCARYACMFLPLNSWWCVQNWTKTPVASCMHIYSYTVGGEI